MEIATAMLLTLPRMYGGYGAQPCELNAQIVTERGKFYGDLVWPKQRVIVEYDSDEFHLSSAKFSADSARRNALIKAGWTVIVITNKQIRSMEVMGRTANAVLRALGRRMFPTGSRSSTISPKEHEQRRLLRILVLNNRKIEFDAK